MHTNLLKHLMYRFIMIIFTFFITSSLIFSTVEAGNNWLDKGKDLLKNYGGDSKKRGITVEEEAAIRTNPDKRTTDLLKRVFGAK